MIEFRFQRDDLLRTRFAISPLFELTQSLAVLRDPARFAIHVPWVRAVRPRVRGLDLNVLAALVPPGRGYAPDFVAPPPDSPLPDFDAELARVAATPAAQARREVGWAYERGAPPALAPLVADPARELPALAEAMRVYWERAIAPFWDTIRATLERDIARRAAQITRGGASAVFADLHPEVAWRDGVLQAQSGGYDATVELGGRGLLLVPSVFQWPRVASMFDPPWQPAVIYPPPGMGELWAPGDAGALEELLGRGRARVLLGLAAPITTTELAARLRASPAGVSAHLGVLRRAGLVHARRDGRRVLYDRTPAGEALLGASRGSALRP